jgi:hypothetical protein
MQQQPNRIKESRIVINDQNIKKVSTRFLNRRETNSSNHFNFFNTICFNKCICNKQKRDFVSKVSKIIDCKVSIEYFLELTNNFEILKRFTLNEKQYEEFNNYPYFNIEEQLNEFKN